MRNFSRATCPSTRICPPNAHPAQGTPQPHMPAKHAPGSPMPRSHMPAKRAPGPTPTPQPPNAALTEADRALLDAAHAAFQLTARHDRAEDARAAASSPVA